MEWGIEHVTLIYKVNDLRHTKTGSRLKVSSEGPVEWGIEPVTFGLQERVIIFFTMPIVLIQYHRQVTRYLIGTGQCFQKLLIHLFNLYHCRFYLLSPNK